MPHFLLRKADALDDRESLECDAATVEGALLEFGRRLNAVLSLDGDTFQYSLLERDYNTPRFGAYGKPVSAKQRD